MILDITHFNNFSRMIIAALSQRSNLLLERTYVHAINSWYTSRPGGANGSLFPLK
jgi:hypothetical protein